MYKFPYSVFTVAGRLCLVRLTVARPVPFLLLLLTYLQKRHKLLSDARLGLVFLSVLIELFLGEPRTFVNCFNVSPPWSFPSTPRARVSSQSCASHLPCCVYITKSPACCAAVAEQGGDPLRRRWAEVHLQGDRPDGQPHRARPGQAGAYGVWQIAMHRSYHISQPCNRPVVRFFPTFRAWAAVTWAPS